MNANQRTTPPAGQAAKDAVQLIGILSAISVVSKRMALKLAVLEQRATRKEGAIGHGRRTPRTAAHANQGHTL